MGLIDFVKNVGKKILGNDDEPQPAAAGAPSGGPTPEQIEELQNRKKATALVQLVQGSGIPVEGLVIDVHGDKVTFKGRVKTQEEKEKLVLLVGNHADIGQVDDEGVQVTEPAPEATYYEVQKGDTLWKIAEHHYGNGSKYPAIFEANKPMLKDPDHIYPGQKLRIPKAS
jgi:nucleoid-associated protein YgaU